MMKQAIIGILFLYGSVIYAQGLFERSLTEETEQKNNRGIEFSGYARGSVYGGSKNYDYSTAFGESCLRVKLLSNNTLLYTDIRVRSGIQFDNELNQVELKEAYAGYSGEQLDVLLGNQIVIWGRTDGFNPTNNITPDDYFFLTSEPDDQKLSNLMLRIRYRINPKIDLDFVAIPVYKPSVYRYDLFDLGEYATFTGSSRPDRSFKNGSVAARLNFELSSIGFSLSFFRGYDPFHGFNVKSINWPDGLPEISYSATPYLKNTIGADFAIPAGSWVVRGEFACNITEDYEQKMYVPDPDLQYVAGLEKDFCGFNTIIQYVGKYTPDFSELVTPVLTDPENPLSQLQYANELIYFESAVFNRKIFYQQEELNHALSLAISRSFAYETWNTELSAYYNITSEEYMLRPKVSWRITGALSAGAGYVYMAGPGESVFGYSEPVLNGGFLELKVSF
ncbi:MAG: hypothetical protein JW723_04410 [Bacteroidales bacterium]|nr:hypothetical protein [Bacteroidales bacterium]